MRSAVTGLPLCEGCSDPIDVADITRGPGGPWHPDCLADRAVISPKDQERCGYCEERFSLDEWEDRHTDEDGEDVHARCCGACR